jgi:hypothetical protein
LTDIVLAPIFETPSRNVTLDSFILKWNFPFTLIIPVVPIRLVQKWFPLVLTALSWCILAW